MGLARPTVLLKFVKSNCAHGVNTSVCHRQKVLLLFSPFFFSLLPLFVSFVSMFVGVSFFHVLSVCFFCFFVSSFFLLFQCGNLYTRRETVVDLTVEYMFCRQLHTHES